jgi:hypothetical protein
LQQQQRSTTKVRIAEIEKKTTVYQSSAAEAVCAVDAVLKDANC